MFERFFSLPDEPGGLAGEYSLVRVSRRAMATTFEIAIPVGTLPNPIAAGTAALDLIDALEDQLTVYRDHSELVRLNTLASRAPQVVENRLYELLVRCRDWTNETDGAFDIATGALVRAWGFLHREGRVPSPRERSEAMARTGTRHVVMNDEQRTVKFLRDGLAYNLGAVGKGYALDRAASLLREHWGVRSALLHGGGSSVLAIGTPPGDPRGWPIQIRHPAEPDRSLGTIHLRGRGVGTSAATFQYFEYKGVKLGHLLDPRTGWPAAGTASASVTAPSAAEADAMSTAVFVLGATAADRLTRLRPALGAVVLNEDPPAHQSSTRNARPTLQDVASGGRGALSTFNLAPDSYSPPDRGTR